jgi:exopolysaccharide production protein ExoZ
VDGGPIIPLGWTLNAEVFFYIVFGVCVALPFGAGTAAIGRVFTPETYALRFWTDPIFLDFVWGVALAVIYRSGFRLSAFVCRLLVLVSAVPLFFVDQPFQYGDVSRPFTFGISAALLVAAATLSGTDWNASGPIAKGSNALAKLGVFPVPNPPHQFETR